MDPPIINEASFSAANASFYSLAELWPFPISCNYTGSGNLGGLGLRMVSLNGFGGGDVAAVSLDESTVTEQSGSRGCGGSDGKKRKDFTYEDESSKLVSTSSGNDLNDAKRMKASGVREENNDIIKAEAETSSQTGNKPSEHNTKSEPPKDYIHVRARRGQATDSHSLAERARREKISERMKILQYLVPGCNKLAAPPFDATAMIFSRQAPTGYAQARQPEWLHMHVSSSFERAT